MYKETRETVLTILLTALIVGGGMYWFYNSDRTDDVPEDTGNETVSEGNVAEENEPAENEIGLPGLSGEETSSEETSSVEAVVVGEEENVPTELETAKVFEPKIFTNKIYKYSIDFPKDWYWHHYGIQKSDGSDIASFDSQSLPETLQGEYAGKVVIIAGKGAKPFTDEEQIAEMKKWLNNVTVRTIVREGPDIKIVRGEMTDGLSMGSTNVRMSAYLTKDDIHYSIGIAGPTPEEEKIFEQMVASFRFEE